MKARTEQWIPVIGVLVFAVAFAAAPALGGFIDFEDGTDREPIASTIPGLEFTNTEGYDWVYGDWRTGNYNGPFPDGPDPTKSQYYSNGNFFGWMGTEQGTGVITFTAAYATTFSIGYSSGSTVYIEAYDEAGGLLGSDSGPKNLNTGRLDFLQVEAPGMAYIMIHDTNNRWIVDDLDTDAVTECVEDIDCNDGLFCNGVEKCIDLICYDGESPCEDDGKFCNGEELCDEDERECFHSGNPCEEDQYCDEKHDRCSDEPLDDEEEELDVQELGGCGCGD